MADKSSIEWTDATWNPIVGCSVISPGCTNCYAMAMAARLERMIPTVKRGESIIPSHYSALTKPSNAGPVWTGRVTLAPDHILTKPLHWKRPRKIFVNSMGDLFHKSVPDAWIDRVFAVMAFSSQHTFQILTKHSKRMREYLASRSAADERGQAAEDIRIVMTVLAGTPSGREMAPALKVIPLGKYCQKIAWPLPNLWLGVTAEDQTRANERIPDLLATPAATRFVSVEPMLGPVDLASIAPKDSRKLQVLAGLEVWEDGTYSDEFKGIDWVIAGGESGPNARPMHPDWARSLRDQCAGAGVPYFFKQWGEWISGEWFEESDGPPSYTVNVEHHAAPYSDFGRCRRAEIGMQEFVRVGKRAAGSRLDGREHKEFPDSGCLTCP